MRSLLVLVTVLSLALVSCSEDRTLDLPAPSPAEGAPVPDASRPTDPTPAATETLDTTDATDTADEAVATGEDAATSPPADSPPIPVEGEGDIGDGSGPQQRLTEAPRFGVSTETDSEAIPPYTSCWSGADSSPLCIDGFPQPQVTTLAGSEQLVITYEAGELTADASASFDTSTDPTAARPEESTLPVQLENPGIWLVDISGLEPGDHAIGLSWFGEQGDAFTAFTLTIER